MHNFRILFLSGICLALFSGCERQREDLPGDNVVFSASLAETVTTKTSLKEDGGVVWGAGEDINIFYGSGFSARFTSSNTSPSSAVDFKGSLSGADLGSNSWFWGVYPYSKDNACDGESVTVTLPSTQKAVAGSFDDGLFITVARTKERTLMFYNVCGGVKFSVSQDGIKEVRFKGNNNEALAGKARIRFGSDGRPQVTEVSDAKAELILKPSDGNSFQPGKWYYFVSFPAMLSGGYQMSFIGEKEEGWSVSSPVSIVRSRWGEIGESDGWIPIDIPDPAFKAYLVENFDKDSDGEISRKEALEVYDIEVHTGGIVSLKGIEYFLNLRSLNVEPAEGVEGILSDVDLTSNTELVFLNLASNNLTDIDLSNCTKLTTVVLHHNDFQTLDLSALTNLVDAFLWDCCWDGVLLPDTDTVEKLFLDSNGITNLDVSKYINLKALSVSGNPLSTLNIRNNPGLEELYCHSEDMLVLFATSDQKITGITVDRSDEHIHPATEIYFGDPAEWDGSPVVFEDDKFKQYCLDNFDLNSDGEIGSSEAMRVTRIEMFTIGVNSLAGIERFSELEVLIARGNDDYDRERRGGITSVDLSGNPNLGELNLGTNRLTEIDLSKNLKLSGLTLWGNDIETLDISFLKDLHGGDLAANGMKSLQAEGLSSLGGIYLYGNGFTSLDISSWESVEMVSLDWCDNLESVIFPSSGNLREFYCRNSNIKILDVSGQSGLKDLWCSSDRNKYLVISEGQELNEITNNRSEERISPSTRIVVKGHPLLETGSTNYEIAAEGGTIEIPITTQVDYEAAIPSGDTWLQVIEKTEEKVVVSVDANASDTSRSSEISLNCEDFGINIRITITQKASDTPAIIPVEEIRLDITSLSMVVGETRQLTATVLPSNATDKTVTWTSSDSSIVEVNDTGRIRALNEGQAVITASAGGCSAVCTIIVAFEDNEFISFKDKEVESICLNNWDTNNDGRLSFTEAKAVTSLNNSFSNKSITSFDELRYFVSLEIIDESEFRNCDKLISIILPTSITVIKYSAFEGCTYLSSINLPNSLNSIESRAFKYCRSLESIVIPNSISIINFQTFSDCSSLKSIVIPDSVSIIDGGAFRDCTFLPSIELPYSITYIDDYAFAECFSLTSIIIPDSVTYLGKHAFDGCRNLASIKLPSNLPSIEEYLFHGCSGLSSISLPDSITSIGESAFFGCHILKSIEIPRSVTNIGGSAFCDCYKLSFIKCLPYNPPTVGTPLNKYHFLNIAQCIIYVPLESLELYKTANGWKEHSNQIQAFDNNTE